MNDNSYCKYEILWSSKENQLNILPWFNPEPFTWNEAERIVKPVPCSDAERTDLNRPFWIIFFVFKNRV